MGEESDSVAVITTFSAQNTENNSSCGKCAETLRDGKQFSFSAATGENKKEKMVLSVQSNKGTECSQCGHSCAPNHVIFQTKCGRVYTGV